jgi:hypothetical protein
MRIQLDINDNKQEQIEALMEKAGFQTYSELFNSAVSLAQWSIHQIEAGRAILSVDRGSGAETELAMPFLIHVERHAHGDPALISARRDGWEV